MSIILHGAWKTKIKSKYGMKDIESDTHIRGKNYQKRHDYDEMRNAGHTIIT